MPPSRRRPVPTTPTTRPRVAGLRKRPAPAAPELDAQATPVEDSRADGASVNGSSTQDIRAERLGTEDEQVEDAGGARGRGKRSRVQDAQAERSRADEQADEESAEADRADAASAKAAGLIEPGEGVVEDDVPEPAPRPRPTGRRKRTGEAVAPSVLDDQRHKPGETDWAARYRASTTGKSSVHEPARSGLGLPIALFVLAGLLVGLGVWFQNQASGVRYNKALVDSAGTTEVAGQAREAVEKAFSYDFTDVSATEQAADELLVGKAKCQYNAIFDPVRKLAPEQKLVVTVKAVSSGVTSLDGDRATVLLFLDQVTTRTTDNQSGGGIAMMRVGAQKVDGRWRVDNMEMFGQTGDQAGQTAKC